MGTLVFQGGMVWWYIDGWMDGWTDGQMDGWIVGWMAGRIHVDYNVF